MWSWLKDNGAGFIAVGAILTFLHFFVVTPLRHASNQNFETLRREMNQRFDAQDRRIEDLAKDVSDLRRLSERISRNEGQIDVIRRQLQTADAPSP